MNPRTPNRAVFYHRDSDGSHEMTPPEYIRWAQQRAREFGAAFHGAAAQIQAMMRSGAYAEGDIFLDYGVSGNLMSRPGLDRLLEAVHSDLTISHLLIPRRDRLARPDDPVDAMQLENKIRRQGVTIVYTDRVLRPLGRGRIDIAEQVVSLMEFDASGAFRRDHARKMLDAQLQLASQGFSTGGRDPFGFRRWLVNETREPVRELEQGESVRKPGHHVVWLPGPDEELDLIRRILAMLETLPASRVAAILTAEGIPSPNAGRTRKDQGVVHHVSGVWRQNTIVNIARNALLLGDTSYGRRSMGDQLRFSPQGPRELQDSDLRHRDGQPKVIRNPEELLVKADAPFAPLVNLERHHKLLENLDERGGKQRGKPRSPDPDRNPLGCRIFDLACGWPMYRQPYEQSFRYTCGLYQQSHAQKCGHHHVSGPQAARFLLSCLRQRVSNPRALEKLRQRLQKRAEVEMAARKPPTESLKAEQTLADLEIQLKTVQRNLARAGSDEQYAAISQEFDRLKDQEKNLRKELAAHAQESNSDATIEQEVQAAFAILENLQLLADDENYVALAQLFQTVNARLFLKFEKVPQGKRQVNRLVSGIVTFGESPPPVPLYEGPTSRKSVKTNEKSPATASSPGSVQVGPDQEGGSLGNVSRADRI